MDFSLIFKHLFVLGYVLRTILYIFCNMGFVFNLTVHFALI